MRRFALPICALAALTACAGQDRAPADAYAEATLMDRYANPADGARFLTVDGVSLHYRQAGSGPALILLPGHMGSLIQFAGWAEALRDDFTVIRLDWPPYGMSGPDPSGQYSTDRAAELLAGFIEAKGFDRVHLGGTSNGATVVLHYAVAHPDKVGKIVVSTVPYGPPGEPARPIPQAYRDQLDASMIDGKLQWNETLAVEFLRYIFGDPDRVTPEMAKSVADLARRDGSPEWIAEYIRTNIAMYQARDLAQYYRAIEAPVLVQWGDLGPVLAPDYTDVVMPAFQDSRLIRYRAGHMLPWELPEETAADARAFLLAE